MAGPPDDVERSQAARRRAAHARRPSRECRADRRRHGPCGPSMPGCPSAPRSRSPRAPSSSPSRPAARDPRAPDRAEAAPSGFADACSPTFPDPVILVDRRVLVIEANAAARALMPGLKPSTRSPSRCAAPTSSTASRRCCARRGAEDRIRRAHPDRADLRGADRRLAGEPGGDGRPDRTSCCSCAISPRRVGWRRCGSISSPMPATSCARRSPRCSASSRRCRARPATTRRRASASSRSCASQAQRMTRLIDDLLSLSRIEMREHLPPTTPVDLVPLARQMVDTHLAARARARRARSISPCPTVRSSCSATVTNCCGWSRT